VDTQEQARRPVEKLTRTYQRGWVGLVAILIALVIVAWLAQGALRQYGLLGGSAPAAKGAATNESAAAAATPPRNAIERARGVEQTLQQGAEEQSRRIDEQTK
jgi:hypothetical protein